MGILDSIRQIAGFGASSSEELTVQQHVEQQEAAADGVQEENFYHQEGRQRPQDDVPTELIIHYIVRDYQRMLRERDMLVRMAKANSRQIEKRAKAIAKQLDTERPAEIAHLQEVLSERNRQVERLQDTTERMKGQMDGNAAKMASDAKTIELQRSQIRALLQQMDETQATSDSSWHHERWQTAMEQVAKLSKQLATVRGIVTAQPLEQDQMNIITNLIEDCRRQVQRISVSVKHIAPSKTCEAYEKKQQSQQPQQPQS